MMNDNEYGKFSYNRTDDGKKELRVTDKDNFDDVVNAFRESSRDPNVQNIEQLTIDLGEEKQGKEQKIAAELITDIVKLELAKREGSGGRPLNLSRITIVIAVILLLVFIIIGICIQLYVMSL